MELCEGMSMKVNEGGCPVGRDIKHAAIFSDWPRLSFSRLQSLEPQTA
jgi:hypothetical protein